MMTPERMREIRETMHLPVRSLARWTDRAESTLRAMEAGQRPIPADLARWLEQLERWQKKFPPPEKTR